MASSGRVGARNGGGCKGVIAGVPLNVSMEEFKRNFKGGKKNIGCAKNEDYQRRSEKR